MIRSLIGQQGMAENVPSSPSTIVHTYCYVREGFQNRFFKSTRQADLRSILSKVYKVSCLKKFLFRT